MMLSPSADVDGARLPSGGRAEDSLLELEPEVDRGVQHAPKRTIFPSLEGLPTELRTALLLNLPDLTTLSRLVHASVVFHAQYLLDRKSILSRALLSDATDDVFVDVYAAFRSHSSRIGPLRGPNTNTKYVGWLGSTSRLSVLWPPTSFRGRSPTSAPVPFNLTPNPFGDVEALTRSEKACLTRAYYRFEVFCHLFCGSQYESFIGINVNEFFFSDLGLEPWEAQEMYCIYVFVKKYEAVVKDVKWDLDERNPRFDDEFEPELEGSAFPVDKEYDGLLNGTIGHGGLNLALKMIMADTHDERLDLMTKSLQVGGDFFEEAVAFAAQRHRRDSQFNDRDHAEERRQVMPFAGDDAASPPPAWTLLWGGRYSNLFGEYVPDALRRWGYVMWDSHRTDVEGTKEYLKKLWASSSALMLVCRHWAWMHDVPEAFGQFATTPESL